MKGIPYDHAGEVKVLSFRELHSVPRLNKSFAVASPPEPILATIETAETRPGKVKCTRADKVWHLGGQSKCKRGGTARLARQNFGAKVRKGVAVCGRCRAHYYASMYVPRVHVRSSKFFDKYADAHAPVDVMSK